MTTGQCLKTLAEEHNAICEDNKVYIGDLQRREVVQTLDGHSGVVAAVAQSGYWEIEDPLLVFDFTPFLPSAFDVIIAPRLAALDQDNTQAPSALLEIFTLRAARPEYPSVVNLVLDMVEHLLTLGIEDTTIADPLVAPHLTMLLHHLTILVEHTWSDQELATPLAQRQIRLFAQVAHYIVDAVQAGTLVNLLVPLLRKPLHIVPERTKVDMLRILRTLFLLIPGLANSSLAEFAKLYEVLSLLFLTFRANTARSAISATFNQLVGAAAANGNDELQLVAALSNSLNACLSKRIHEPDFDHRLAAFATLNDQQYEMLTCRNWLPVLYNVLHFVQDPEELVICSNATYTLCRFISVVAQGLLWRQRSQLLHEHLSYPNASLDACTSSARRFFGHRRSEQLNTGGRVHAHGRVLCWPTTTFDHLLVAEAIGTLGRIAKRLQWSAYYSLVQKYLRASKDKDAIAVWVHVRSLVSILENFLFSLDDSLQQQAESAEDVEAEEEELTGHEPFPKEMQITRLLTVLSQALRNRSQDTRDLVHGTMCRIIVTLGQSYLPYAVRGLRAALMRGPQLYALAYVIHTIISYVTAPEQKEGIFADLDTCIDDIVYIASEVVFGESGKDVQSEDFKTKMREVKASASKGLDTFALTTSQNSRFLREAPSKPTSKAKTKKDNAIFHVKRKNVTLEDQYAHNLYRFIVFGLELFNTAFRRSHFNLCDNQILSRLEPFVVLIRNTLYVESEAILIAGLKAVPAILHYPQILSIIRSMGSVESEISQTALKSLAVILRDCPTSDIKENDLLFLLELLAPDLEDSSRQDDMIRDTAMAVERTTLGTSPDGNSRHPPSCNFTQQPTGNAGSTHHDVWISLTTKHQLISEA
ncbi:hypothetical protein SCLCIDRAFT_12002 [Scleroderma citrinum Foug A]|uniref:U3 small nucleolar RNA-associated protein 20 N-terminal domain-containing protein n=1 Tax=Scleroderma citrinum Foug A TaxID=1036808 RepID=A0A0C3D7B3_9AGAM|nr:hypothetical protein SCLCIDRAFT_12002 [Scleroderma citrinum Foug A]